MPLVGIPWNEHIGPYDVHPASHQTSGTAFWKLVGEQSVVSILEQTIVPIEIEAWSCSVANCCSHAATDDHFDRDRVFLSFEVQLSLKLYSLRPDVYLAVASA